MQHIKLALERSSRGTKLSTIDFLSAFLLPFVSTGRLESVERCVPLYRSERWDCVLIEGELILSIRTEKKIYKHGSLFIAQGGILI